MKIYYNGAGLLAADPELLREARGWIADCDGPQDISDQQVVLLVERNYDGGWAGFTRDATPMLAHGVKDDQVLEYGTTWYPTA